MSTPDESVPSEPPVTPEEAAAQDAAAQAEAAAAAQLQAIRELAAEIAKQTLLDFDPATIRKGTVTAIADTASPPTLSVQISGDTTTTIDGIRSIESYVPVVGDTALIIKQGTDLVALGKIAAAYSATSWTVVTLGAGWTHNGNGGGQVRYRRIWDNGSPKMQWRGVAARSSGTVAVSTPLATGYRPLARVPVDAGRSEAGGATTVKLHFETDGTVVMVGGTTVPTAEAASGNTGSESSHSHGMENNVHDHGGGVSSEGSHTHGIANNDHNHGGSTNSASGHSHTIPITTHKHGSAADGEPGGTTSVNNHSHSINETTHKHGSATAGQPGGTTGTEAHSHTLGSHTHTLTVTDPVWISFNGIEYFLD
ncbi:hypothetical protein DEJ49_33605 [Streptomyces venezuelae]|uniref:Uncharacterized protein n=1 Tax=Streptomyces venezuelae TaxID=54571 RepID=A0A5P2CTE4_STRVZ|nr:hypothetical protein [Streptomyces venezuelae]QES45277.1 hypothetical protein DEJ49_33605 [Streptomyces venezuelae]